MIDPRYKDKPLSDDVSPEEALLLVRVMEEASELIQCAAKILRFGPTSFHPDDPEKKTNIRLFRREVMDLRETLRELGEESGNDY